MFQSILTHFVSNKLFRPTYAAWRPQIRQRLARYSTEHQQPHHQEHAHHQEHPYAPAGAEHPLIPDLIWKYRAAPDPPFETATQRLRRKFVSRDISMNISVYQIILFMQIFEK
jgi:hypothetical protein